MELTEKERLMLVGEKEKIRILTTEILDISHDPKNKMEIMKKITSILSHLTTIGCYSSSKWDLDALVKAADALFRLMWIEQNSDKWVLSPIAITVFCNHVNSVRFDFIKRDIKIRIPKIDFSIFKQSK